MMTSTCHNVASGFTPDGNALIASDKRGRYDNYFLFSILTITILLFTLFTALPAHAALGDFLYNWGGEYHFQQPSNMAMDSNGNMYVTSANSVYVFNSTGKFIRKWGSGGSADGRFGYDWQWDSSIPEGIAVDGAGNVYVADTGNNRIQVFSNTGTFIRKWGRVAPAMGNLQVQKV